jgi:hypothetical protein
MEHISFCAFQLCWIFIKILIFENWGRIVTWMIPEQRMCNLEFVKNEHSIFHAFNDLKIRQTLQVLFLSTQS